MASNFTMSYNTGYHSARPWSIAGNNGSSSNASSGAGAGGGGAIGSAGGIITVEVAAGAVVSTLTSITQMASGNAATSTEIPGGDETVSQRSTLEKMNTYYQGMHGYFAVTVCIFGIVSNLLNIIVLTRRHMRSPTNFILTALAIADILTMSPYVVMATYFYILNRPLCEKEDRHTEGWMYFILFHNLYIITCHMIAMWLTVSLAVFRYIFVCRHQLAATMCSMQRARLTVLTVVIGSIVSCIPNCFMYKVDDVHRGMNATSSVVNVTAQKLSLSTQYPAPKAWGSTLQNATESGGGYVSPETPERPSCYYVVSSEFAMNHPQFVNFVLWLFGVVIKVLPCIVLAYLSLLLIIAMQRAKKRRARLLNNISRVLEHDSSSEHNRTTKMLVAVVLCFVITELPQGVAAWIGAVDAVFFARVYVLLGDFMDILVLINSAVNFILYCIMSQQFRDTFKSLFVAKKLPFFQRVKGGHSNGASNCRAADGGANYSIVHTETTHV